MKKSITLSIIFLISIAVKAGWNNPKSDRITTSTANVLQNAAVLDVMDHDYTNPYTSNWNTGMLHNNVVNKVVLGIDVNQAGATNYYSAYTINMVVNIDAWDASGTPMSQITTTLSLNYDPTIGAKEDLRTIYTLSGYHRVKVTVVNTTFTGGISSIPDHVYLETFIQSERFYTVAPSSTAPASTFASGVSHNGTSLSGNELEVSWNPLPASETPEAYELEWTYSQNDVNTSPGTFEFVYDIDFKNNATNVVIKTNEYKIPLVYEKGLLVWRVRAIYYNHTDLSTRKYSEWSSFDDLLINRPSGTTTLEDEGSNTVGYAFFIDGFASDKNWQYSISFAEDGKNKASISYFDGALKNRQSVTRVNSDGNTIVGQTIYDFNGRPAIQVLPIPVVNDLSLTYKEALNKSAASGTPAYSWKHFDVDATGNCTISKTHAMSATAGAEQYYSASSPGLTQLGGDRIPKAEGYPFVQTEYTPDNTGRVRRQGGVGLEHRLTGTNENNTSLTGHESEYFYGTPSGQAELDRLFGNEIGDYKHYKKNMVIDPNGQVSISYLDPQGRVVATALAGDPNNTPNLDNISTSEEELFVDYENTEIDYNDYSLVSHRTILVEKEGLYKFYYKVASPKFTDACLPINFCFDCIYDIELTLKDECGQDLIVDENLKYMSGLLTPVNAPELNTTCSTDSVILELRPDELGPSYEPFEVNLPVGKYTIFKKLTVNKVALEYYKEQYIDNLTGSECDKTLEDFITEEKANLDYTKCNYTCSQCYIDANGDAEKIAQCDEFCKQKDQCYGLYLQMKNDMSLGGQYFDNVTQNFQDDLSAGVASGSSGISPTDASFGYNAPNDPDRNNWLDRRAPSSVKTAFFTDFNTRFAVGGAAQFSTWDDIRDRWQPEFAEELVKLHPEYCYYEKCLELEESYKYDQRLMSITDGSEAVSKGYFNPIQMSSPDVNTATYPQPTNDERDPFFYDAGGATSDRATMKGYLINYDNSHGNVWTMVEANQTSPGAAGVETGSQAAGGCLSDYDWYYFRALYLAEKQKLYKAFYQSACNMDDYVLGSSGEKFNTLIFDDDNLRDNVTKRKVRRFYFDAYGALDKYEIDYTSPIPVNNDLEKRANEFCKDQCTINAEQWMDDIKGCKFSISDKDLLKAELIAICELSCDEGSDIGAASTSNNYTSPNGNKTFEEAFEWMINKGGYSKSDVCNIQLITFPAIDKPHFPAMAPLDSCACNKISLNATNYTNLLASSSLPAIICSEAELFAYTYNVEVEDLQLLKCLCNNNLNKYGTPPTPPATDICFDEYSGRFKCIDSVSAKAKHVNFFIEHLISNYNMDAASISTITNARNTIPEFFSVNSLIYPNAGNLSCIPQVSFGSLLNYTEWPSGKNVLERNVIISDNCGFSCTLTVKLYKNSNVPDFSSIETWFDKRSVNTTSSTLTVGWSDAAANMTITTCFTDLQCTQDEFIYPEAFVPASIACQRCLSCEDLATEFAAFKQEHPYLLEPQVHADLVQRFTDYLNFNLNYNYTLTDVEDLFDQCTENTTCSTTTAATALKALIDKMASRNDLGKATVDLNSTDYPELYNPAIYSGNSSNSPQIKNNNPYYYPYTVVVAGGGNGYVTSEVSSSSFLFSVTHPVDIIDGVLYPVIIKITATVTTTESTTIYIGDSLGGGRTIVIPPLNMGDVYYVYTLAMPYVISGSPNSTQLRLNATYIDDVFGDVFNIPEGTVMSGFDHTAPPTNSFTITDNNGFDCTIKFDMPDGLSAENIAGIVSIFPDPYAIAGSNVMKAKVLMKGSTEPIEVYIHSTCHLLTTCGTLSTSINKCPTLLDFTEPNQCTERLDKLAEGKAWIRYNQYLQDKKDEFEREYIAHCMQPFEKFGSTFIANPYQITLYYYDQADNIIKTVPPKGVNILNQASVDSCLAHREDELTNQRIEPNHEFITYYKYNTLNQLIAQRTPDAGVSNFWYDRLGRLVLSQNAKQISNNHYSYTQYDGQGRITEVGELTTSATLTASNVADDTWLTATINSAISTGTQITKTFYDEILLAANTVPGFVQQNLRKRVVTAAYYENYTANNQLFTNATHYTYDVVGNVNQLVQDNPELNRFQERFKTIHYNYDHISGNVNLVAYQPDSLDQFYHYYKYDVDNRLHAVYTSRHAGWSILKSNSLPNITESHDWVLDAKQFYYKHGPLVRAELGERQVQGSDYTYTLQGWLKAINSTFGTPDADGNEDGLNTTTFARDAFGFELGYYTGDYKPIAPFTRNFNVIAEQAGSSLASLQTNLYNGNISYSVTSLPDSAVYASTTQLQHSPKASLYKYDQLNRLTQSMTLDLGADNIGTNSWQNGYSTVADYSVPTISYDKNGNITALQRNAENGNILMDNFAYHYDGNTNKLTYVDDAVTATNHYEDIDDQSTGNYTYDNIGNLISDAAEEIATIEWTVYGKVKSITRTGLSLKPDLEFTYDATGKRLSKKLIPKNGDKPTTTYYIYDASGNIMAIYQLTDKVSGSPTPYIETLKVTEFNIYGGSRVGVENVSIKLAENNYSSTPDDGTYFFYTSTVTSTLTIELGNKNYELKNHLGNVLVTITDRRIPFNSSGNILYNTPDIASVTDYYPFGMRIEKRSWSITKYRYGMNRQERDDEIYGEGNSFTAEFWQYDSRLGRRWNVDPVVYSSISGYACFFNNPITYSDANGDDPGKKVEEGDGPSQYAQKNGLKGKNILEKLSNLAKLNPEVFKNYSQKWSDKQKWVYWNDNSGKNWRIDEGQRLEVNEERSSSVLDFSTSLSLGFGMISSADVFYEYSRLIINQKKFLYTNNKGVTQPTSLRYWGGGRGTGYESPKNVSKAKLRFTINSSLRSGAGSLVKYTGHVWGGLSFVSAGYNYNYNPSYGIGLGGKKVELAIDIFNAIISYNPAGALGVMLYEGTIKPVIKTPASQREVVFGNWHPGQRRTSPHNCSICKKRRNNPSVGSRSDFYSDSALKCDIVNISKVLPLLLRLNSYKYSWKSDSNNIKKNQEYGLIAQELKEVWPELVSYDSSGKYLKVAYYQMIPILVAAIKEQQNIIKQQEELFQVQEKRLQNIEKKIDIIINAE